MKRSALGSTGVGTGVAVGGTGVAVGGTGVAVGGTEVAVGGTEVAVGGTEVAVGSGTAVAVGATGVSVGLGTAVAVGLGTAVAAGAGAIVATGAVSEAVSPPPEQAIPIAEIIKLSIRNLTSFIGPPIYSLFKLLIANISLLKLFSSKSPRCICDCNITDKSEPDVPHTSLE